MPLVGLLFPPRTCDAQLVSFPRWPATAPTQPIRLALDMDHKVHIPLPHKVLHPIANILQIGRVSRNNVDDAHDLLPPRDGRAVIVTMMAVGIGSGILIVDPEARDCVADYAAKLAELLQGVLDVVFDVVGHDEEEFLAGGCD